MASLAPIRLDRLDRKNAMAIGPIYQIISQLKIQLRVHQYCGSAFEQASGTQRNDVRLRRTKSGSVWSGLRLVVLGPGHLVLATRGFRSWFGTLRRDCTGDPSKMWRLQIGQWHGDRVSAQRPRAKSAEATYRRLPVRKQTTSAIAVIAARIENAVTMVPIKTMGC